MENTNTTLPSITSILKKISDDKALTLFNSIAVSNGDRYIPLREMNLTTKQYYSRISGLLNAGLVKRHKGKLWVESNEGHGSIFYFSLPINNKELSK